MKRILHEALEPQDQIRVYELEQDILDLKIRMVNADENDKENLKRQIEDIQNDIADIKAAAEE